jgi:uncharacterized protein (TIGR02588 family)
MRPHWIEWITGLCASLIVLAITGWVLFEAITSADHPPELSARVLAIDPLAGGWRVMIEVENAGDQAAAAVEVKAALVDGTIPMEEAELTFDYVAGGSTARGGFFFTNNPSENRLQIAPTSFTDP